MTTDIKINLDKICAEFGLGLLNIPYKLYEKVATILSRSTDKDDFFLNLDYAFDLSEDILKDFSEYKLIDPLETIKTKIRKSQVNKQNIVYEKLKNESKKFHAKEFETEINKALCILVEDGPFAYMIWLKSQSKEPHSAMLIQTARILKELNVIEDTGIESKNNLKEEIEEIFLGKISNDLNKLFFVKTILEKMLTYARYKAKAKQKE